MFTIESITNPVYTNADGTSIEVMIKFAEFSEAMPFAATSYDSEEHGRLIYADLVAGKYGAISPYVDPPVRVQPTTQGTKSA